MISLNSDSLGLSDGIRTISIFVVLKKSKNKCMVPWKSRLSPPPLASAIRSVNKKRGIIRRFCSQLRTNRTYFSYRQLEHASYHGCSTDKSDHRSPGTRTAYRNIQGHARDGTLGRRKRARMSPTKWCKRGLIIRSCWMRSRRPSISSFCGFSTAQSL